MAVYTRRLDTIKWTEQHLYGSSRLGIWEPNQRLTPSVDTTKKWQIREGQKRYELTNHLGNVLVTVNDRRKGTDTNADTFFDVYDGVEITATDYFPFGLEMPGRTFQTTAYRFGFNGKENDRTSWSGTQLVQDYGMRLYNPAIARFLSVDPLSNKFPWYSPYEYAGNKPIAFIDLDGAEPTFPQTLEQAIWVGKEYEVMEYGKTYFVKNSPLSPGYKVEQYFKGEAGTFSNAQIWKLIELHRINYKLRSQKKQDQGLTHTGLCTYDCLTLATGAARLLFNDNNIPAASEMKDQLSVLAKLGYAGDEKTFDFVNKNGQLTNGTSDPVGYDKKPSDLLVEMTNGKKGYHVFGISLADGFHSLTVILDNTGTSPNFAILDQTGWTMQYQMKQLDVMIGVDFDDKLLNFVQAQSRDSKGNFTGIKMEKGLSSVISQVRKYENKEDK